MKVKTNKSNGKNTLFNYMKDPASTTANLPRPKCGGLIDL
jgi:hypothetical protein